MLMAILDLVPGIIDKTAGTLLFKAAVYSAPGVPSGPAWDPVLAEPVKTPCRALVTKWSSYSLANGLVGGNDRKVLISAESMRGVVPKENGSITINGETFTLVSDGGSAPAVAVDPARAIWVCRGRA